jgi:hypothetical protein
MKKEGKKKKRKWRKIRSIMEKILWGGGAEDSDGRTRVRSNRYIAA